MSWAFVQVMQHTTDVEKVMAVPQFLDSKRKNKVCKSFKSFRVTSCHSY